MALTVFLLIRHAQSLWNAAGRWQGQSDPPLSPVGRAQADAAARELRGAPIDLLLSSDLDRALETARRIGAPHGLAPQPDSRLRELDVGSWSGLTREEIEEREPEMLERFFSGDPDVRPGGGETRREIRQRVRHAMLEIARQHEGSRVAVVTHLGVIRALLPDTELGNAEWVFAMADQLAAPERKRPLREGSRELV
jgi:broad specificity phosphatase PhoE